MARLTHLPLGKCDLKVVWPALAWVTMGDTLTAPANIKVSLTPDWFRLFVAFRSLGKWKMSESMQVPPNSEDSKRQVYMNLKYCILSLMDS